MSGGSCYRLAFGSRGFQCIRVRFGSQSVVLPASSFDHVLNKQAISRTDEAFRGSAIACLPQSSRGRILQSFCRLIDAEINPDSVFEDAFPGQCVDGRQRGAARAEYDWRRDGLRIECKSSMISWRPSRRAWGFHFSGIKRSFRCVRREAFFDELIIMCVSPSSIHFYRHDGQFGISSHGISTASKGHQFQIQGPSGVADWSQSLDAMLEKLEDSNRCIRLAVVPSTDSRLEALVHQSCDMTQQVFEQCPLSDLSPATRALRIQELVRCVDAVLKPHVPITSAIAGLCRSSLRRRGSHQAEYDWCRGGVRVECKSARLRYEPVGRRWGAHFNNIKFSRSPEFVSQFDELLLGLYTPQGIYIYRHDSEFGLASQGIATAGLGYTIQVYGPTGVMDWKCALDSILHKFDGSGCQRIAFVQW